MLHVPVFVRLRVCVPQQTVFVLVRAGSAIAVKHTAPSLGRPFNLVVLTVWCRRRAYYAISGECK